jgi:hypothetical protein
VQEVRAGGSFLSQSSSALWFAADPVRVTVRWPGGVATEHAVAAGTPALELQHP